MAVFTTNPLSLKDLLKDCEDGKIQLPDFQRSWVWDDERIRSLIASISQAFPIGALMTLATGGPVRFKPRPIEGAPDCARSVEPQQLLLDGQQRLTSLYQTCMRREVVRTITARRKVVERWYYFDIRAALDDTKSREDAIIGIPEDRVLRTNFGKDIVLDLSSPEKEYEQLMYPINQVFDWDNWLFGFFEYWSANGHGEAIRIFRKFTKEILENFKSYHVPVIGLGAETSREAVCLVFEKVNTGGKALDAFELVTAMYAAQGFELRKDWLGEGAESGRYKRLATFGRAADQEWGLLAKIASTDFLQAISLIHTKERRAAAAAEGREGRDLPPVSATRQSLLNLPLEAYKAYADKIEDGFKTVAKFLRRERIYRVLDIPYQSQFVPLAVIFAEIGRAWENATVYDKIARWFWNGVFGELYGSATESRFARDVVEVPAWIDGGDVPTTIIEAVFRADRLLTMRTRLSAAYKGIHALLMKIGAKDFRSGQEFDHTVFFDESVDIHHIFPRDWCKKQGIPESRYDSIINKTPLSSRTNRILGGDAPSVYLARLERGADGSPPIPACDIDSHLESHLIDPALLRADNFEGFFAARQAALLRLIEDATGQAPYSGEEVDEPGTDVSDEEFADTLPAVAE